MSLIDFFILIIATAYQAHGQACTWTWVQPSGSGSTLTRSVGAVATFSASVNDVLTDTALLTWKSGTTDLSIEEYSQASDTFTPLVVDPRGVTTSFAALTSGTGHVYNMSFPTSTGETLQLTDSGASFTVTSQGCASGGTSPNILLTVSYCDLNAFSSEANAANTTDCGYNCVREFTCISDPTLSFQATCLVDATWSDTTPTAANRCKFCNATDFEPSATEANSSVQAGVNQAKKFNCVCPIGIESFTAECQTGLVWNYTTSANPCHAACNASEVTFASPANDSFLCGVQPFTCDSQLVCKPTTFDLECAANGTWISTGENQCSKEICRHASVAEICGENCQYENVSDISCGDSLVYNCTNGTRNTTSMPVICNASGSFNYSGPLCAVCNTNSQDSCQGECCDGSCAKKRTAIGFAASGSFIIAITDVYLFYLHQSVEYRVFKTWIPWIVSMPLLTAVAVTDWILIGISETADTIPPDATLTIGVVLTAVGTAALATTLYCHFKASKKNKTGTSNGGKPISGKVMPETEISDL